jgi:diguanylate cyclase (GGDEF)-like protein
MSLLPYRLATARHVAVIVVLMLVTLTAFVVEDHAVQRNLRVDADLDRVEEARRHLVESLADAAATATVRAERWQLLERRAGPVVARLEVADAGVALSQAALAVNAHLALRRTDAEKRVVAGHLATRAQAALHDMTTALRARLNADRERMLERHRGFTLVVVVLLALEAAWLTLPPLRRVRRAESDAHAAQERLAFLAHHDELTGLANRRALEEHLVGLTGGGSRFGVVLCDLDGFKPINDVYGHEAGDTVLVAVARRLEHGLRDGDLAARLGGDEFVVVAEAYDAATLAAIAERIRHRLADPVGYGGHHLRFTASLGTALHPDDGVRPHALLSAADAAMYEAKQAGGMGVRAYTTRLRERDEIRQKIVRELETALERDDLSVVFQPQIELASGRHVGFEALTRWPSRTRGEVPPSVFIPVAERAGLMPPLTRWLVCEVERLAEAWQARDLEPVAISINVSGGNLVRDDVMADLAAAAGRGALAGGRLGIEITEDATFGRNADAVLERLRLLRERGMAIAIDDFGTGYASLSHLGRIPFDRLKIAGGFIHQLDTNAHAAAVVRAIIELAQRMGGRAVATCVESEEQLRFLRRHRCDEAQGYRFAPPLGMGETESYLTRQRDLRAVR